MLAEADPTSGAMGLILGPAGVLVVGVFVVRHLLGRINSLKADWKAKDDESKAATATILKLTEANAEHRERSVLLSRQNDELRRELESWREHHDGDNRG